MMCNTTKTIKHVTLGISIGLAIPATIAALWRPVVGPYVEWLFTRIEVQTHPDCKPRHRTWKNGIEQ